MPGEMIVIDKNGLRSSLPARFATAQELRLRVHLLRPPRLQHLGGGGLRSTQEPGPQARRRAAGRLRHRHPGPRLRGPRGHRLRRASRGALRTRPDAQPLRGSHVHRARAVDPSLRCPSQAEPGERRSARQARGRHRRLDRSGDDQPQDRQDGARRRCERGARAHLEPAVPVALLLRHRHPDAQRAGRFEPHQRGDRPIPHRRFAGLPLDRGDARCREPTKGSTTDTGGSATRASLATTRIEVAAPSRGNRQLPLLLV